MVEQQDRQLYKLIIDATALQCGVIDTLEPSAIELNAIARFRIAAEARGMAEIGQLKALLERCLKSEVQDRWPSIVGPLRDDIRAALNGGQPLPPPPEKA